MSLFVWILPIEKGFEEKIFVTVAKLHQNRMYENNKKIYIDKQKIHYDYLLGYSAKSPSAMGAKFAVVLCFRMRV